MASLEWQQLTRSCPTCQHQCNLVQTTCPECGQVLSEEDQLPLEVIEGQAPVAPGYRPLHESPNLLALREAVEALDADEIDREGYQDLLAEVLESAESSLTRLENVAANLPPELPVQVIATLQESLMAHRAFRDACLRMDEEPHEGFRDVQRALTEIDRLERDAYQAAAELEQP